MNLEKYIRKINVLLEKEVGLTTDDLPDFNFVDAYADGVSPREVVAEILNEM